MPSDKAGEKANLCQNGRTFSHPASSENPGSNPVQMVDESLVVFTHPDDFESADCLLLSPQVGSLMQETGFCPWSSFPGDSRQLFPSELGTGSSYCPGPPTGPGPRVGNPPSSAHFWRPQSPQALSG